MTSAHERLSAAQRAKATAAQKISAVEDARRAALIRGDDAAAAAADHELIELRLALRRREDEIQLLPSLIAEEEREREWPSSSAAIKAAIDTLSRRLRALQAKRAVDRSAADDADLGHLIQRVPALRLRLEQITRMEAP